MIQPAVEANRNALATLLEESVISRSQLERAEARLPSDQVFDSPAAALHWMMLASQRLLLRHEVRIIREAAARDAMDPSAARRVAIVAQAEASLAAAGQLPARRPDEASGSLSPVSVLRGLAGAAMVGVFAWHLFSAGSAPACVDPDVSRKFAGAILQTQTEAPSPYAMSTATRGDYTSLARLVNQREVGYAKAVKWRGCRASVKVDDALVPVAYVLRPTRDGGGDFEVAGANPDIVSARFSHIDAGGNFSNTAAPVGRAALEQAIRAGVDKLNLNAEAGAASARFQMFQQFQRAQQPHSAHIDPDREREIADLEPNGTCRALAAGTRYTCNVLLERNDLMAAVLGLGGTSVASADFTLERSAAGAAWRVSDDFAAQYQAAKRRSRYTAAEGVSAASTQP